jgi:hypothetical protein
MWQGAEVCPERTNCPARENKLSRKSQYVLLAMNQATSGRIAVKVINHQGDEVIKVLQVRSGLSG